MAPFRGASAVVECSFAYLLVWVGAALRIILVVRLRLGLRGFVWRRLWALSVVWCVLRFGGFVCHSLLSALCASRSATFFRTRLPSAPFGCDCLASVALALALLRCVVAHLGIFGAVVVSGGVWE